MLTGGCTAEAPGQRSNHSGAKDRAGFTTCHLLTELITSNKLSRFTLLLPSDMIQFPFSMVHLIDPIDLAGFINLHFEKKPLLIHRDDPGYYASLLSIDGVDQFLTSVSGLRSDDVQLVDASREIGPTDYLCEDGSIDCLRLLTLFSQGATISFRQMHRWLPELAALCRNAEQIFSCPFQTNIYFTPANAQGFKTHHDTHDTFILQISGSKTWRIYAPVIQLPLPGQGYYWEEALPGHPIDEFTLHAGDLYYCPRGTPHDARSTDEVSLHITLGALVRTWAEFIIEVVADIALRDYRLRAGLPPGYAVNGMPPLALAKMFDELLNIIRQQARPLQMLDKFADNFITGCRHMLPQQRIDLASAADVTLDTRVGARSGLIFRIIKYGSDVKLICHNTELILPEYLYPTLQFAINTDRYAVRELPGRITDQSKLVFIRRMIAEGLVHINPD